MSGKIQCKTQSECNAKNIAYAQEPIYDLEVCNVKQAQEQLNGI